MISPLARPTKSGKDTSCLRNSKANNKYKFKHAEDEILKQLLEQWKYRKINWKLLSQQFNSKVNARKQRKIIELYKRYHEIQGESEIVWTEEENRRLKQMQQKYGVSNNWFQISMNFDTKNSYHCLMQYKKQTDNNIKKGKWTLSEDLQLIISYKVYGDKNWALISKSVPNRTDVQCRERF